MSVDAFLRTCEADLHFLTDRRYLENVKNMIDRGVASVSEKRFLTAKNNNLIDFNHGRDETYGVLVMPIIFTLESREISSTAERFLNNLPNRSARDIGRTN